MPGNFLPREEILLHHSGQAVEVTCLVSKNPLSKLKEKIVLPGFPILKLYTLFFSTYKTAIENQTRMVFISLFISTYVMLVNHNKTANLLEELVHT